MTKTPDGTRLSFLDTNVVQNLHTFGEFVFDGFLSPEYEARLSAKCSCAKARPCIRQDVYALRELAILGSSGAWPLAVSASVATELEKEPDPNKSSKRLAWYRESAEYFNANCAERNELIRFTELQRAWVYEYLAVLPDEEDRILIVDALELGCGVFLTMDYRTVLSHRGLVGKLGIRVMRPCEYLAEMGCPPPDCP